MLFQWIKKIIVLWGIILTSFPVFSQTCELNNANINQIMQSGDGHIFIIFNGNTNCDCSIPNRLAFHKDDNEKFLIPTSLTALTAGKTVNVKGEDRDQNGNCPIHGNTASLTYLTINKN